jgi:hypothetical protein
MRSIQSVLLTAFCLFPTAVQSASVTWGATESISLGSTVARIVADPVRPRLYAVDRGNSQVLIVDLTQRSVRKLYVGKDPTDADIDVSGKFLYVANKGPGTGAPGSDRVSVVDLETGTMTASWFAPTTVNYVTAGRSGHLYYNAGIDNWNYGEARMFNTATGQDLGNFGAIKTRMVISSDKTLLYGQYVYSGNLGEMAVFYVSTDAVRLVDHLRYPPYANNYGWGVDNYCLSGDDRVLGYGPVLFNAKNLIDQFGILPESVGALNFDGTVAFGQNRIWDTTTFSVRGDATEIGAMPFSANVMTFDASRDILFAFNPIDRSIHFVEQTTRNGISLRWLKSRGLATTNVVESEDLDGDGYTLLDEWMLDSDPKVPTTQLRVSLESDFRLRIEPTSIARRYTVERAAELQFGNWQSVAEIAGTEGVSVVPLGADAGQGGGALYRVKVGPRTVSIPTTF